MTLLPDGWIRAATQCERCGSYGELRFYLAGRHSHTRIGVNCLSCGGVAWTIGRYGAERIDGYFFTRLTSASQEELSAITEALAELSAKENPTVEEVASTLARLGEIGLAISHWIQANGGWFGAGSFLIALIMLIIGSGGGGDQIHIDQVIIGDAPTPFVAPSTSPSTPPTPSPPESPELPPGPSGR